MYVDRADRREGERRSTAVRDSLEDAASFSRRDDGPLRVELPGELPGLSPAAAEFLVRIIQAAHSVRHDHEAREDPK
jgi:hypothetical protein